MESVLYVFNYVPRYYLLPRGETVFVQESRWSVKPYHSAWPGSLRHVFISVFLESMSCSAYRGRWSDTSPKLKKLIW